MSNQSAQPTGQWVLRETLASEHQGKPMYFWKWTAIGPMTTDRLDDAERFESKQLAMAHPAYSHYVSCYEPEAVMSDQSTDNEQRRFCDDCSFAQSKGEPYGPPFCSKPQCGTQPRAAVVQGGGNLVVDYERDTKTGEVFTVQQVVAQPTEARHEFVPCVIPGVCNLASCGQPQSAPVHQPAAVEQTVESALTELRETFGRHVEIKVNDCVAPGCKAYKYQIGVQHLRLSTHGATLAEAMQAIRKWHKENQ